MKKVPMYRRVLAVVLVIAMMAAYLVPGVSAADPEEATTVGLSFTQVPNGAVSHIGEADEDETVETVHYNMNDVVRVSIVLEQPSTLEKGYSTESIAANASAMAYRDSLKAEQAKVTAAIETATGSELDVAWNLTLAANIISANVKYGDIAVIEKISGVKCVEIENRYEPQKAEEAVGPNMGTSSFMIGSQFAWANGYTGAGSKVAVIDTGIDDDHQSFAASGYNYAMGLNAEDAGMTLEEYKASVGVMTQADVEAVKGQLNVSIDASRTYLSDKVPYAYNYVDKNYTINHDSDSQGEHGSHVEGIAASNRFIPQADGTFKPALETVMTQGVAPDAQIVTMKVFGKGGGAYDSDYMAAIEDAIVLGCDSANLSLGSGSAGFAYAGTYQKIMDSLTASSTVVAMSAGNSGGWYDTPYGSNDVPYLYIEDVGMHTGGSPGTFTNSLGVASVDNSGNTGMPLKFGEVSSFYAETSGYSNPPIATTIPGDQPYVFFDNTAVDGSGNNLLLADKDIIAGKVALVYRGASSFYQKMDAAAAAGAIACIVVNNQPGVINMDLTDATAKIPCVSITQDDGELIKAASEAVTDEEGNVLYWQGTVTVTTEVQIVPGDSMFHTVSDFSSWGVPGSLTMKPEISAPGGSIYAVNGAIAGGTSYESMSGTSMASPQVAGMAAVVGQYIRANDLTTKTGLTARQLTNSLLMSTAVPMIEDYGEYGSGYWPVIRQGSGLANVGNAVAAKSYIMMAESATLSAADGKVKAELGDDPERTGVYEWSFTVNNFSDEAVAYTFSTDLFTQDLTSDGTHLYMDTWTRPLNAEIVYTVNGETYAPVFGIEADVDMDGDTDNDDVQAILEFVVGNKTENDINVQVADINGDQAITSADAYELLQQSKTSSVEVAAGAALSVTVKACLTEEEKAELDEYYLGGAYVQGYTFVTPLTSAEGEITDVEYSVPVLAFYGSWTDASMFDAVSQVDVSYGTNTKVPYVGNTATNALYVRYGSSTTNNWFLGNPYGNDKSFPKDRLAVGNNVNLYQFRYNIIRNAAAIVGAVTNEEGEVIYIGSVTGSTYAPYYNQSSAAWTNRNTASYTFNKTISSLGVQEGEKITFGLYALPEYYAPNHMGTMTADQIKEVIESGVLGDGAAISYTAVVDNTAPVVTAVAKDLLTGSLIVTAQDDNYIATVSVVSGTTTLASAMPEQDAPNQETSTFVDLEGKKVGQKVTIMVGDYAGNEATYEVAYGSDPVSYDGQMFAYTANTTLGAGWKQLDPATITYSSATNHPGIDSFCSSPVVVKAAEYVDGYVFIAGSDNNLYAAKMGEMDEPKKVGALGVTVTDMAFNYADGKLYAIAYVNNANVIYSVDLVTGELTQEYTVSITNPRNNTSANYKRLLTLAIDGEGNFYSNSHNNSTSTNTNNMYGYLYNWTANDVQMPVYDEETGELAEGSVTAPSIVNLAPVVNTNTGYLGVVIHTGGGALAWDHNTDKLYMTAAYNNSNTTGNNNSKLYVVNTETGKATAPNSVSNGGRTYGVMNGLFIVPAASSLIKPADGATKITISAASLTLMKGKTAQLTAEVFPWTLEDKSVTWASSDASIATVEDGLVTAISAGEATITVASAVSPEITASCTVTVTLPPEAKLSGLIYAADGTPNWSDFSSNAPEQATVIAQGMPYQAGALYEDVLYTHSGDNVWAIDVDTFEVTDLGPIVSDWAFSDAAPVPAGLAATWGGKLIAPCMNGTYLETLNPEEGGLTYWDLSSYYAADPMVAIALGEGPTSITASRVTYNDAYVYYVITESGALNKLTIYNGGQSLNRAVVGNSGIALTGAATSSDISVSMVYDAAAKWLYLAHYAEGETAQLYAINAAAPATNSLAGEFGEGVWPAVALHQYNRPTELTLRLDKTSAELYTGATLTLKAKVLPITFQGGVSFVSDNDEVATVDESGKITAVSAGTATITVTTVDVNAEGEHLSATCVVTVEGRTSVDAHIGALIGSAYVDVNLNDMSTTATGVGTFQDVPYSSGGMAGGKLYGMYSTYFVTPDGAYDFSGTANRNYLGLDMANMPALTADGSFSVLYPSTTNYLINFDAENGSLGSWNVASAGMKLAAIAYVGAGLDEEGNVGNYYYALGQDGKLYSLSVTTDGESDTLSRAPIGDIGMSFASQTNISMTYIWDGTETGMEGLVILDGSTMKMYWVAEPSTAETLSALALGKLEATSACSLYNERWDGITSVAANSAIVERFVGKETKNAIMGMSLSALTAEKASLQPVNPVVGGTNAVSASVNVTRLEHRAASGNAASGEVAITLTEDAAVTNGKYTVTYDAQALTFVSAESDATNMAVNASEAGTIVLAFANDGEIAADEIIATLNFTYAGEYVNTQVTITNNESEDEPVVVEICQEDNGHDYVGVVTTEPTCTEEGVMTYTCSKCGDTYTEEITALGHDVVVDEAVEPTCTETGLTEGSHCGRCGETLAAQEEIPALGHDYEEEITTEPSCTENGLKTFTCSRCEDSYTVEIPALGHDVVVDEAVEPTCTETGLTEGCHCDRCGLTLVAQEEIPALGHSWDEGVVAIEPSYGAPGCLVYTCETCGETRYEEIAQLEFPFVDVAEGDFFFEPVIWALDNGITKGQDDTHFDPNGECTRAAIVTMLWRAMGEPAPKSHENPFEDVPGYVFYADAVLWAVENGITNGVDATHFNPYGACNRAVIVTFIWRAMGCPDASEDAVNPFEDVADNAFYTEAVLWAVENGITNGMDATHFGTNETCNRAQAVTFLCRALAPQPK